MVEMKMGPILVAFIGLILGITFLVALSNSTVDATEVKTVINESAVLGNNSATKLDNNQWVSVTRVGNTSTPLIQTTDYTVDLAAGEVTLASGNASVTNGTYDVSYTYRNVGNSSARTIVNLVTLFFSLAVLLFLIGALSPQFRDMINMGR